MDDLSIKCDKIIESEVEETKTILTNFNKKKAKKKKKKKKICKKILIFYLQFF